MCDENWDDDVAGGVASMSIQSGVPPSADSNKGGFGRGKWFESNKEQKPGGATSANGTFNSSSDQWPSSNGGQGDGFSQYGGGYGQSDRRDNNSYGGDRNGHRGGGGGFGGGRERGGGGGGRNFGDRSGGFNRESNDESSGRPRYGGGGGGYNRDSSDVFSSGNRGGGDSFRGRRGGGGYNRDSNDESSSNHWDNRDSGDRRGRGGRGGSFGDRDDGFGGSGGYNRAGGGDDDDGGRRGGRGGGGFGRGGGGRGGFNQDGGGQEGGAEERPPIYIPPKAPEDEASLFTTIKTGINFSKYNEIEVVVTGENKPPPIRSFEESGLRSFLIQNVKKATYSTPTPVQKYAIPIVAAKRDLMACAQTGSGKTAAFLLPMLDNIMDNPESVAYKEVQEPYALIVAPTRELALQIYTEALKFAYGSVVKCVVAYGGVSVGYCLQQVVSGCHVLVGTPGRLIDIINRGKITFSKLRYFVLDEADRLLDKQFRLDVDKMINHPTMPQKGQRQTLMFSATFDEEVQSFAASILNNYLFLAVGKIGGANVDVEQNFLKVQGHEKKDTLISILDPNEKVLVFIERKRNADFVASILSQKGFPTTSIHGDRFQAQREEALRDFRCGKMMALVATSLASRGLDINEVAHVVNYDLPNEIDDYIHRIGRTGRVGNPGKATSFYDPATNQPLAGSLIKILKDAHKPVPDWLEEEASNAVGSSSYGGFGGRFGSRDIRNPSEFSNARSSHDHWDGGASSAAAAPTNVVAEEESWD